MSAASPSPTTPGSGSRTCEVDIKQNPQRLPSAHLGRHHGLDVPHRRIGGACASTLSTLVFYFGIVSSVPTSGTIVYVDDVVVGMSTTAGSDYSTTTPQGGAVLRYLVNADGAHSAFTTGDFRNTAGTNFANNATDINTYVDDADQTVITDWVIRVSPGLQVRPLQLRGTQWSLDGPRAVAVVSTHDSSTTGANEQHLRISDDGSTWTNVSGQLGIGGGSTSATPRRTSSTRS